MMTRTLNRLKKPWRRVEAALWMVPFTLCLAAAAPAQAQSLQPSGTVLPGLWSGTAHWGDYDADGDADLLLTGLAGPDDACGPVSAVYRNDAGALTDIGAALEAVYLGAAAWGDYDGDGDLDVALCGLNAAGEGVLKVYENSAGSFSEDFAQEHLINVRYGSLAWGDYDGDGDLDLVVSGTTAAGHPSTVLYRNARIDRERTGSPLGGRPDLEVDGPNTERLINLSQGALAWGDVDGDGDLDLALSGIGTGGGRQTAVYVNQAGSLVLDQRNRGLDAVSGGDLAWGDYDNDGDLDLMLSGWSNEWEATLKLYTNAAGVLRENPTFSATRLIGRLAWGDYDNDGDLDLAVAGQTAGSVQHTAILKNDPTGVLSEDAALGLQGLRGGAVAWADADADGDLDLLVTGEDASGGRVSVLYTSQGVPTANTVPAAPDRLSAPVVTGTELTLNWNDGSDAQSSSSALTYRLRIGTAPGGDDVLSGALPVGPGNVGNSKTVRLSIPLARDTYYWAVSAVDGAYGVSAESQEEVFQVQDLVSSNASLRPLQNSAMAWGDYDKDGDADLVLCGRDADGVARSIVYRNDAGSLVEDSGIVLQGVQDGDVAWADLDNDNDLDLVITGEDAGGNRHTQLYRNRLETGDFALIAASLDALPQLAGSSVALGDVDNDGDFDLALMGGIRGDRLVGVYLNQDGTFSQDTSLVLTKMDNGDLAWVDTDNDGDLDLVTTGQLDNSANAASLIYRNDGTGHLTRDEGSGLVGLLASSLAWGDVDNDGDPDLALCGYNFTDGLVARVYTNDGAGRLTDSGESLTGVAAGDVAWGDFDNDGDLDLALAGQAASGRILYVYRNDGGHLSRVAIDVLTGVDFSAVSWADYDGDGDLDLASSGRTSPDETTFFPTSGINDNLQARFNPNRRPSAPTGLVAEPEGSGVTLTWSAGSDLGGTPEAALTYALRVGTQPAGSQIRSGAAPLRNGRVRHNSYRLSSLPSGAYYWSVRTIDKGLLSSAWSDEGRFIIDTLSPVVDSVSVRPRAIGTADRATVLVSFSDEPAGMDNAVSPRVTLTLAGGSGRVRVSQLSFNGGLWIGEAVLQDAAPSGTVGVTIEGARDRNGNEMAAFAVSIPSLVTSDLGGIVDSDDGVVRLTLFPSLLGTGLTESPSLQITAMGAVASPPTGTTAVTQAYDVTATPTFTPPGQATLGFTYDAGSTDPAHLAVYRLASGTWSRVGGTATTAGDTVRVAVETFGTYALFQEASAGTGSPSVSDVSFSNRAFSPAAGSRLARRLAGPLVGRTDISFELGAPASVRVEVYDRAGQLQRVLASGRTMNAGRQVVTWDGRDGDGDIVRSGLYIVVIDADGRKAQGTVAVVNN